MEQDINIIIENEWELVKKDTNWLVENIMTKSLKVVMAYEDIFDRIDPIDNIIYGSPYDFIASGTPKETKQNCSKIISDNLKDLNNLFGTDYYPSQDEIYDFTNIGFLESWYSDIKILKNNRMSAYMGVNVGIGGYYLMNLINSKLLNMSYNNGVFGDINSAFFILSGATMLATSFMGTSSRSHYDHSSKKISYYNSRKELLNPKVSIVAPIHEVSHKIMDELKSEVQNSVKANEGLAIYCTNILKGKHSSKTDLDLLITEYDLLRDSLNLIDLESKEKTLQDKLGFKYKLSQKMNQYYLGKRRNYIIGYTAIQHLVDRKGESIIQELVAL